jgi:starch synthase
VTEKLKVLSVSPEVAPFAKTGGLADVGAALPAALKRLGIDVRLVLPLYAGVRKGNFDIRPLKKNLAVTLGAEMLRADILETRTEDGVPVYLIAREDLYARPNLYGTPGGDYHDNLERFSFFANAALCAAKALDFRPDLIHCHEWQTGLIPAYTRAPYGHSASFAGIPCVFSIHNLGYQGLFPAERLSVTGLDRERFFHSEGLEFWGQISLLKAGIVYSDAITTVSPTYAREIQIPEYGLSMAGILHHRRAFLHGILNGVDYRLWDPARDTHIPAQYSSQYMAGKHRCKESLIREMGLDSSLKKRPLLGMVSRLDTQKGIDLLLKTLDEILALDVGLVVLGYGDERIHQAIREASERHHGRMGIEISFNEPLAHRIMAGADIFLVPSLYEPCGLTQMYALKYGTVPVGRATGGLNDTIVQFDIKTGEGNGFIFGPFEPDALFASIRQALDLFEEPWAWARLMANGMDTNFSWDISARKYLELYRSLIKRYPYSDAVNTLWRPGLVSSAESASVPRMKKRSG